MIPMSQVQAGLAKFIDREIAPSLSGWDRVIVAGGGGLLANKLPELAVQYAQKPAIAAMGIFDATNNSVDVEALYGAAKPYMGTEPMSVKIPMMGITLKIGKKEIDTLYAYIKEDH